MWMSLWYDDFGFQKLKPVRIEEISRYFLFGFLYLVDILRLFSSWTLGLGSGELEADTLGMTLLLLPIPKGAVGTPLLSSCTNPWFFLTTNFRTLLALWLWALSFPALFTVLFIPELCTLALGTNFTFGLNTFCTFAFGTFSTADWYTFPSFGWHTLWTLGDLFGANSTYFTFSAFGALGTALVEIPAYLRCILFLLFFTLWCYHYIWSGSLSLGLDHTLFPFLSEGVLYPHWLGG